MKLLEFFRADRVLAGCSGLAALTLPAEGLVLLTFSHLHAKSYLPVPEAHDAVMPGDCLGIANSVRIDVSAAPAQT